jgi:hypothetical protein
MPRPRIDLDTYRDEIERRIAQKHTHPQILSWLAAKGGDPRAVRTCKISETYSTRLRSVWISSTGYASSDLKSREKQVGVEAPA